jgi:hypothetical protein
MPLDLVCNANANQPGTPHTPVSSHWNNHAVEHTFPPLPSATRTGTRVAGLECLSPWLFAKPIGKLVLFLALPGIVSLAVGIAVGVGYVIGRTRAITKLTTKIATVAQHESHKVVSHLSAKCNSELKQFASSSLSRSSSIADDDQQQQLQHLLRHEQQDQDQDQAVMMYEDGTIGDEEQSHDDDGDSDGDYNDNDVDHHQPLLDNGDSDGDAQSPTPLLSEQQQRAEPEPEPEPEPEQHDGKHCHEDVYKDINMAHVALAKFSHAALFVLFVFYFWNSSLIFSQFQSCDDGFMPAYPWIQCSWSNGEYVAIQLTTMTFFMLYVVGFPALLAVLLWYKRKQVRANETVTEIWLGFLYEDYLPSLFWFELVYLVRPVLIAIVDTLVPSDGPIVVGHTPVPAQSSYNHTNLNVLSI